MKEFIILFKMICAYVTRETCQFYYSFANVFLVSR